MPVRLSEVMLLIATFHCHSLSSHHYQHAWKAVRMCALYYVFKLYTYGQGRSTDMGVRIDRYVHSTFAMGVLTYMYVRA